ncbi:MAG: helix-turn-helix domain-containing protein [Bacteroidota bacterium]
MEAVFFIGIGVAVFLGLLLVTKRKRERYDFILLSWLLVNALHLVYFYFNILVGVGSTPVAVLVPGALLPYVSAPILFLYIRELVSSKKLKWFDYGIHFIPYLLMLIAVYYYLFFDQSVEVLISNSIIFFRGGNPMIVGYYSLLMAFSCAAYINWSIYLLIRHKSSIKQSFSYTEKITFTWLRHWLILEFVGFWFSFIIVWVADFDYIDYETCFKIISVVVAVNIFVIGYFGVRHGSINIQHIQKAEKEESPRYSNSSLTKQQTNDLINTLEEVMQEEKLFLNPKLNADQLATAVNVSRHSLSEVLNNRIGINFYDYVNQFRLKEFKEKLANPNNDHLTILGIAMDSGFNSKSSFNLIFKKSEGITPTQYKKQISS